MDINKITQNDGLNLACLISGVIIIIFTVLVFSIYSEKLLGIAEGIKDIFTFLFVNISFLVVAYILGFIIQGIRYLGFNYYMYIYEKAQPGRLAGKKYPGIYQRIIFYLFRNGTAVEECLDNLKAKYDNPDFRGNKLAKKIQKKRFRPNYDWIQKSGKRAPKDMWIFANRINKTAPQDNVFRFYNWSEVFQCLDTTFLFFLLISIIVIIANVSINIFCEKYNFNIVLPIILAPVSLLLHFLSKSCSKMYARRFLFDIDNSLKAHEKQIEDENKKQETHC